MDHIPCVFPPCIPAHARNTPGFRSDPPLCALLPPGTPSRDVLLVSAIITVSLSVTIVLCGICQWCQRKMVSVQIPSCLPGIPACPPCHRPGGNSRFQAAARRRQLPGAAGCSFYLGFSGCANEMFGRNCLCGTKGSFQIYGFILVTSRNELALVLLGTLLPGKAPWEGGQPVPGSARCREPSPPPAVHPCFPPRFPPGAWDSAPSRPASSFSSPGAGRARPRFLRHRNRIWVKCCDGSGASRQGDAHPEPWEGSIPSGMGEGSMAMRQREGGGWEGPLQVPPRRWGERAGGGKSTGKEEAGAGRRTNKCKLAGKAHPNRPSTAPGAGAAVWE